MLYIILPAVFLAGALDAIAGGGGLISLPAYLAAGVPPHLALGTNKFSACFGTALATARYIKHRMVDLPVALSCAGCAILGSAAGARAVLLINPSYLHYVLLVAIPVVAWVTLKKSHAWHIDENQLVLGWRRWAVALGGSLLLGGYDGFFGPGTGSFLILLFVGVLRYDFVRANGNTKVVNLGTNVAALAIFAMHGQVSLQLGVPAALASIAGNWVGSKLVVLRGSRFVRPVFLVSLLLLMIKVIVVTVQSYQ